MISKSAGLVALTLVAATGFTSAYPNDAEECNGWECDAGQHMQYCPPDRPGSHSNGFTCCNKKWVAGDTRCGSLNPDRGLFAGVVDKCQGNTCSTSQEGYYCPKDKHNPFSDGGRICCSGLWVPGDKCPATGDSCWKELKWALVTGKSKSEASAWYYGLTENTGVLPKDANISHFIQNLNCGCSYFA